MANHKSAKKRAKQNIVRRDRNIAIISRIKTFIKKVENAILKSDKEVANKSFKVAMSEIHKGVKKGTLKKNTASRKISRLNKKVKTI